MINISFQERSDSLFYPVINDEDTLIDMKTEVQWHSHSKRVFSEPYNYGIDIGSTGITVDRFGNPETKWETMSFHYMLGIDLDLDASGDVMAIDSSGILYGFNSDLVLMSGFPIDMRVDPPILAKNLFGNDYPEIIARSTDKTSLLIFDSKGNVNYDISIGLDEELRAVGEHKGKNAVFTSSTIFQFDDASDDQHVGNEWTAFHGDMGRSRSLDLEYEFESNKTSMITRSYCYPNPIREGRGTLRVESISGESVKVMIYDLAGYFLDSFTTDIVGSGNQISEWVWNVGDLDSGVYFAHVDVSNGDSMETTIIKIAVIH